MSRFLPLILSGRILGHPFSLHLPGRVAAEAAIRPCKEPACLLIGAKPPFEPGHGDLSRRAATGFTVGGEGWYRKRFRNEGLPSGAQVQVLFDGVYMESDVWLNGRHLGRRVRGYAPFSQVMALRSSGVRRRRSRNPSRPGTATVGGMQPPAIPAI